MFDKLIVQPVFNLLELIYALVPGHDLGVAIILFTLLIRLALWPLVKKQLHHARAMKKLQPELKKLKKAAAGDRQKEARLQMELYKEHEVKPFATIGTLIIQIPIFIALYQAILKITNSPASLIDFSYQSVRDLSWIQYLAADISRFDETFLGLIDLTRKGLAGGEIYFGALLLGAIAGLAQYYQSKLMLRDAQDARKLSVILKEAAAGKETDQGEVGAAVSRAMMFFLPFGTFLFSLIVPSALSLYLMTTSIVGYFQQRHVLQKDTEEMQVLADEKDTEAATGAIPKKPKTKKKKSSKKRRKR